MARRQETKEIQGVRYRVTQLGARLADQIQLRFAHAIVAALAAAEGGSGATGAIVALSGAMSDASLELVTNALASQTLYEVEPLGSDKWLPLSKDYDEHFAGAAARRWGWTWFALEVNFADFFAAAAPDLEAGRALLGRSLSGLIRRSSTTSTVPPAADTPA